MTDPDECDEMQAADDELTQPIPESKATRNTATESPHHWSSDSVSDVRQSAHIELLEKMKRLQLLTTVNLQFKS